jgi:iron complex outermembrane recepter protein
MTINIQRSMLAGVAFSALMVGTSAWAQADAGGDQTALEEVVVTARFRAETTQNIPIAITALSAADLDAKGFSGVVDVAKSAPNVTLIEGGGGASGGGKSAQAFIRGVGQADFSPGYEPGVGFYLDDVYYGSVFGSTFSLGDIDRVEILRWPQGTLFGKNNEGGAVRLYTTTPGPDNQGYAELTVGSYDLVRFRGALDITVIPDKLFLRASGGVERREGFVDLVDFACANPALAGNLRATATGDCTVGKEGGSDVREFRLSARYLATPDLTIDLSADVTDDTSEAAAQTLVGLNYAPGSNLANVNQYVNVPLYGIPLDNRFIPSDPYTSYASFCEPPTGRCIPKVNTMDAYGVSARVSWDAPMGLKVRSITAFRRSEGRYAANPGGAPIPLNVNDNNNYHRQFTQEVTVSGQTFDEKLEWTVGGFYYDARSEYSAVLLLPGQQILPPPLFGTGVYGLDFTFRDPAESTNRSGFVHGIYSLTDKLSLEAGVRYTSETKTYATFRQMLPVIPANPLFPSSGPFPGFENNPSTTTKTDRVDPKVAIQYQWAPNFMTYAQFATGYKGGGVNPRPIFPQDLQPFGPETLKAYEVGFKSDLFDRRLRVNAAAFLSDYKDLQVTVPTLTGGAIVVNTGQVRLTGLEAEVTATPIDGLSINASGSYLDYDIRDLGDAAGVPGAPRPNSKPAHVPKVKLNAGIQYEIDLGALGTLTPRADWTYQSKVYNDPVNIEAGAQSGYSLVNLRVAWKDVEEKWSAALQVQNATDKLYYLNKEVFLSSYGYLSASPGMPRTVSLSVRRNF